MDATSYVVTLALMSGAEFPDVTLESLVGPRPAWHARRACADADPALFFPDRGDDVRPAKAICAGCPVKGPCLDAALADPSTQGIWGETSTRERQGIRRRLAVVAA